ASALSFNSDPRRRPKPFKNSLPVLLRFRLILSSQPVYVISIRTPRFQSRLTPARLSQIASEQLLEHGRSTPSIEEQMMMAPDKLRCAFSRPYQSEMHQRRYTETEFTSPSFFQVSLQTLPLFIPLKLSPIISLYFQLYPALDHLQRLGHALPGDPGTQNRVPVDDRSPRPLESINIQIPIQLTAQLRHIDAGVRLTQAMKEHPLLHGRERIDVFDLPVRSAQFIQRFLVQPGEREI